MGKNLKRSVIRRILIGVSFFFASFRSEAAALQPIQVTLYWEGRQLQQPNVEALEKFRAAFPEAPILHLLSPSYFIGAEPAGENLQAMLKIIRPDDEVGLYLSSIESLLEAAKVPLRFRPTFWGNSDEKKYCQEDCGLDVPLLGRSREELLQIFLTADRVLRKHGFQGMQTYGVRGWLFNPVLPGIAASFAYRFDHTPLVPGLLSSRLKRYPLAAWLKDLSPASLPKREKDAQVLPINGSVIELSEHGETVKRFTQMIARRDTSDTSEAVPFRIALSQESAYFGVARLGRLLEDLQQKSREHKLELVFVTPGQVKNGRPNQENMRISKEF